MASKPPTSTSKKGAASFGGSTVAGGTALSPPGSLSAGLAAVGAQPLIGAVHHSTVGDVLSALLTGARGGCEAKKRFGFGPFALGFCVHTRGVPGAPARAWCAHYSGV